MPYRYNAFTKEFDYYSGIIRYPRSALFADQRDNAKDAGSSDVANRWYSRMLTEEIYNDLSEYVQLMSWDIVEADPVANELKVAGDQTAYFPTHHRFCVRESTGNDTEDSPYRALSSSYASELTTISVASVADGTNDGVITNGMFKFIAEETYTISGWASAVATDGADIRLVNISGFTYSGGYVVDEGSIKTDPLCAGFCWGSDNTSVHLVFETRISPSAGKVWEAQQWNESVQLQSFAHGTGHLSGQSGHGGVINHAMVKITAVV